MKKIFISHSVKDVEIGNKFLDFIESLGFDKSNKKSHSERNATIHKNLSNYIQNSILSKKIEYSQVKSLMNTQYGASDGT